LIGAGNKVLSYICYLILSSATFEGIRHLKIGMEMPWLYIIFAVYTLLIIMGFVFAIWLVKNKRTRTAKSKAALTLSSRYISFFTFFIYLTIAANI
jgi:bacteriorhodopsin